MRLILAIASMLLMVQLHSCIAIALDESYSEEYWTEMAYKLYYEKYYDLALMCINKSIYINSNNSSTWLIKGKILAEIGSQKVNETEKTLYFRQSLNCYNGAIQINPLIKEAWIGKSSILYSLKRYNESLQAYDRASELDPKNASLSECKAELLKNLERYDEAAQAYDRATELDPNNSSRLARRAAFLKSRAKYDEALLAYGQAIELDPNNPSLWAGIAENLRNLGLIINISEGRNSSFKIYDVALRAYDRAIELDANNSSLWEGKAESLQSLERYNEAVLAYNRSIELDSNNTISWTGKAESLQSIERYDDALLAYDRAIELSPENYYLWRQKARSLKILKKNDSAAEAYNKATELNPENSDLWNEKSEFFKSLGRYKEAFWSDYKSHSIWEILAILIAIVFIIKIIISTIWSKEALPSETLEQALSNFEGVKLPIPHSLYLALLIIAEFIIIYSTRLDKWNLVPGLLALLLIFNAFRSLLQRIPKVLGALWHRHLIAYQSSSQFEIESNDINQNPVHDLETEYSKFVDEFRERLNRRSQWLLGLISSIGGYAMASMSLSEEMQYNHLIINLILGSFIGLVIGLMAWRMAVITYMVGEMGRRFDLNIQFGNPDKCGGLEPLGNLCFWNSLVLSIPSIYLTLGILVLFDFSQYSWYDSEIAKKLIENAIFVIPTMIVIINFIFSQLSIHKIMLSKRDN